MNDLDEVRHWFRIGQGGALKRATSYTNQGIPCFVKVERLNGTPDSGRVGALSADLLDIFVHPDVRKIIPDINISKINHLTNVNIYKSDTGRTRTGGS